MPRTELIEKLKADIEIIKEMKISYVKFQEYEAAAITRECEKSLSRVLDELKIGE